MNKVYKNNYPLKALVCIFSSLLLAFLFASCPNPTNGNNPGPVDTSALEAKIAEANAAKAGVRVDTLAANVPLGISWVFQAEMDTYTAAINAAESVRSSAASQPIVNSAVTALNYAINAFTSAKKPGTGAPIDLSVLVSAIFDAKAAKDSVVVASNAANVAQGMEWVTSAIMYAFEDAITTAETARDNAVSQTAVNSAADALNAAIAYFNSLKHEGTKTTGFTGEELAGLINSANQAKQGVFTSIDGNDIGPSDRWVTQSDLTILNFAIAVAQGTGSGEEDINEGYLDLAAALADFRSAIKPGNTPDKTSLMDAIASADTAKQGVEIASSAALATSGSEWATTAQWAPFNSSYASAVAALNNSNASVNIVGGATASLVSATSAFSAAVYSNGPGTFTGEASITITGLSGYSNGTEVRLNLLKSLENLTYAQPEVYGFGIVLNNEVTIELLSDIDNWHSSGPWYIGFMIEVDTEMGKEFWSSNSSYDFSMDLNPSLPITAFTKMTVFSISLGNMVPLISNGEYTFNDLYTLLGKTVLTVDDFIYALSDGHIATYDEFKNSEEAKGLKFYRNQQMTNEWKGTDTVTAASVIYTIYPFWIDIEGGDDDNHGAKIGEITGTISLTNIPGNVRNVRINSYGSYTSGGSTHWWYSYYERINGISGSSASNITWSIPVYEDDLEWGGFEFNRDWNCEFRLYVELTNDKSYDIYIPGNQTVNIPGQGDVVNVDPLGTVSLAYAVLSGTINVSYNGDPVPYLSLSANWNGGGNFGRTGFAPGGFSSAWEILFSPSNTPRDAYIYISGSPEIPGGNNGAPSSGGPGLFGISVNIGEIPANGGKSGIVLNLGNFEPNTVRVQNYPSGTYDVYIINIIGGIYLASGSGSGDTIPLDWKIMPPPNGSFSISLNIVIFSDSGVRYNIDASYLGNGMFVADWDSMEELDAPIILSNGVWADSVISSGMNEVYYWFSVTSGTTYYFWWNDVKEGDGIKTLDVLVSASPFGGGPQLFYEDSGWNSPQSFTADFDGIVIVQVQPDGSGTGTYGIVYSTSSTRPPTGD